MPRLSMAVTPESSSSTGQDRSAQCTSSGAGATFTSAASGPGAALDRVGFRQARSDDLHPVFGRRGSEGVWVELGERRKPVEESLHAGRRECDEHRAITVADVLPGVRHPARDEHERARTGEAQLIAQLPADFAPST